jgi:serine/threonine protein phosphatase 1
MTIYAIGDAHGALGKLNRLLSRLDDASHLVFLGDYLDKGPDPRGTVETIRTLARRLPCTFLIGNHEFAWLRHVDGEDRGAFLARFGARETLASYLGRDIDEAELGALLADRPALRRMFGDHLAFLRGLVPFTAPPGTQVVCVHGGIAPGFGDQDLARHDLEKLVFLRFGRTAADAPWRGRVVVAGHTVVGPAPQAGVASVGIDTGAWSDEGRLTALDLEAFRYVQDDGARGRLTLKDHAAV